MEIMSYGQQNMNGYKKPTNDHEFIFLTIRGLSRTFMPLPKNYYFLTGLVR